MTARLLCHAADFRFAQKSRRILVWSFVVSVAAFAAAVAAAVEAEGGA